jgi:hypothetical protein
MKKSLIHFESVIYWSVNKNPNGPLYVDLHEVHLQLNQISDNKPKTKKKIIKIVKKKNYYPRYARIKFVTPKKS